MQSIRFECSFDAVDQDSDSIEDIRRRAELMIKARNVIEEAGGALVRTETCESPAMFKVPSNKYDLLSDQLDDLVLENIVKMRKESKEVEICIDDL